MKFDAILAVNNIAREIRDSAQAWNSESMDMVFIVKQLQDIEAYLSPTNQPTVKEIITSPIHSGI